MDEAIFKLYSNGYKTSRDAYIYNFSRDACAENARKMVGDYLGAMRAMGKFKNGSPTDEIIREITGRYSSYVRWDRELKNNLKRKKSVSYQPEHVTATQYRPFVRQHCYVEYTLANNKYQMDRIFPDSASENRAIYVPGVGSTKPFSALVVDTMPDLHLVAFGQCFPRYRYQERGGRAEHTSGNWPGTGAARQTSRRRHCAPSGCATTTTRSPRTRSSDYVYGVLHAPVYRRRFADDLTKELPRIPLAPDFHAFGAAGRELAELHLGYEACEEYPLEVVFAHSGEPLPELLRIGRQAMRFDDDEKNDAPDERACEPTWNPRFGALVSGQRANTARVVH